ncbi:MAG: rhodanese-like domain-containing protein [Thalassovita sp.]
MVSKATLSRRSFLAVAGLGVVSAGLYVALPSRDNGDAQTVTPAQAHALLQAQKLTLIDVRRPDEWTRTGVAPGADLIDLRRDDFVVAVKHAIADAPNRPVAVICAAGVRSARMTRLLTQAGVIGVIDIPEGMTGSRAGPGWLDRGLPVLPYPNES